MAGYLMFLADIKNEEGMVVKKASQVLQECFATGTYSTLLTLQKDTKTGMWSRSKEATFADYLGMRAGDYLFFFFDRKIYGIGKLKNIGDDCKAWGYLGANRPIVPTRETIEKTRLLPIVSAENRCVCFFESRPGLLKQAVDMDEALMSYPDAFRALRVVENVSFKKMDDEETYALISLLLKKNLPDLIVDETAMYDSSMHEIVAQKLKADDSYKMTAHSILLNYPIWNDNGIQREMMVEAALMEALAQGTIKGLPPMKYFSHQVAASPAKPISYMEWMDAFGYSEATKLRESGIPEKYSIDRYYVFEIKRGALTAGAKKIKKEARDVCGQIMKYVDWVAGQYTNGSYPMVDACIVANSFDETFLSYCVNKCIRNYNSGYREAIPEIWKQLHFIEYKFDGERITFRLVQITT